MCRHVYVGDVGLVDEVLRNHDTQERLAREDPQHPARAFGEYVEAQATATPSQELVATTCETVIQSALPAFTRALLEGLAVQFERHSQRSCISFCNIPFPFLLQRRSSKTSICRKSSTCKKCCNSQLSCPSCLLSATTLLINRLLSLLHYVYTNCN